MQRNYEITHCTQYQAAVYHFTVETLWERKTGRKNNDKYNMVLTVAGDQTKSSETCLARKPQRSQWQRHSECYRLLQQGMAWPGGIAAPSNLGEIVSRF